MVLCQAQGYGKQKSQKWSPWIVFDWKEKEGKTRQYREPTYALRWREEQSFYAESDKDSLFGLNQKRDLRGISEEGNAANVLAGEVRMLEWGVKVSRAQVREITA